MAKKKTLLVLLLVVSLALMLIIVYFIKTKFGYFGYSYHQYIENMALQYDAVIETNMNIINSEIQYLSKDNLIKSVFTSSSRGEDTSKFLDDFDKIKNSIQECQNIQVLDSDGDIIFSNDTNEINNLKIVPPIIMAVKGHFSTNYFTYVYMKDRDSLAAFYTLNQENTATANGGFVVVYYKMAKLFTGISKGKIIADGAISNMLITSKMVLSDNNINYLMNYLKSPENYKKIETNEKSVYVVRKNIHGIEVLYYPSNERYIPVLGLILLVTCLLLFILVVSALIMVMRDEKIISDMPIKPINVNIAEESAYEKPDEIKSLISDIEEDRVFGEKEVQKGIEDMIMTNGFNLTESIPSSEVSNTAEVEKEEFPVPEFEEIPAESNMKIPEPLTVSENNVINTYSELKPTKQTDLFAEEERILSNIESQVPFKEERSANLEGIEEDFKVELKESFHEPEFPSFETMGRPSGELNTFQPPELPEIKEFPDEILNAEEIQFEAPVEVAAEKPAETPVQKDTGLAAMMETPEKVSPIITVEDFGKIAVELAKRSLNIHKILVLEKHEERYIPIIREGIAATDFKLMTNDPIFTMFLSGGKGIDVKGNIRETRYFREKFEQADIEDIDEIFITPIIKNREITGVAFYLKQIGTPESTHLQKSELLNLSFLQGQ